MPIGDNGNNVLVGTEGDDWLNGMGGHDDLSGLGGDDELFGGPGVDTMRGGLGNDLFWVGTIGDTVIEGDDAGDYDQVNAMMDYELPDNVERLFLVDGWGDIDGTGNDLDNTIIGNSGDNTLRGGNGDDRLTGGGGADSMFGGNGDDIYDVDSDDDFVAEFGILGYDQVNATVDYTLKINFERLVLMESGGSIDGTGNGLANLIFGNTSANTLRGNGGADIIYARAGNDTLFGGSGADSLSGEEGNDVIDGGTGGDDMFGGAGDDLYIVASATDDVHESANEGDDLVLASLSHTLDDFVEKLWLTADGPIDGTGNALANTIYGNGDVNTLNGLSGADTLVGFGGNDWLYVDNAGDVVTEGVGGGTDRVLASTSYTLGAAARVEYLLTTNSDGMAAINLTGNDFYDDIRGNDGANTINGRHGDDVLIGNGGADSFLFDTALNAANNVDEMVDFQINVDEILLDNDVFLGIGTMTPGRFHIGAAATTTGQRIIYNEGNGGLFYDEDGMDGIAQVRFATLDPDLALDNGDFLVVG